MIPKISLKEKLEGIGVPVEIFDGRDEDAPEKISELPTKKGFDMMDLLRYSKTLYLDRRNPSKISEFNRGIRTRIEGRPLGIILPGLAPFVKNNGGSFLGLARYLRENRIEPQIISYNWRQPFVNYSNLIADQINVLAHLLRGEIRGVFAIGHSTGADVLRYAANTSALEGVMGLVLASPSTGGIEPDWTDRRIFGDYTDYCNPSSDEGQKVLPVLQRPLDTPALTLINLKDAFVPPASSVDYNGRNVVLLNQSHVRGTGINQTYNRVYLECLRDLMEPRDIRPNTLEVER